MPFVTSRTRRAPAKRRKARRNPRNRFGKHRPSLIFGKGGWRVPKRGRLIKRGTRINPRRKSRRKARVAHVIRYNPFMASRAMMKRRSRRRVRRNPNIMKALTSKTVLMQGVTIGGGIVGGSLAMPLLVRFLPANITTDYNKYLGVVHVALGALMFGFLKNKNLKQLGLVIAGTGMYDLVAMNAPIGLPPLPRSSEMIDKAFGAGGASASYPVSRLPVSPVARLGVPSLNASYQLPARQGWAASYSAPGSSIEGFSGDNPYLDIPGYDG